MKGKDKGKGNVVARDDWETPQWLFNKLNEQYNFSFDCCASKENTKCSVFSEHFLFDATSVFYHNAWINPPFSKARIMIEHFFKSFKKGVGIYHCDNIETKTWQFILNNADWVHIFDKRINYEGKTGKGAVFGSALFGIGLPPPKDLGGTTVRKWDESGGEKHGDYDS